MGKIFLVQILLFVATSVALDLPPPCSSPIYCSGDLLKTVQTTVPSIYPDSKTFVDMSMNQPPNETLALFATFMSNYPDGKPPADDLKTWVETNFSPRGSEFVTWTPNDFTSEPEILKKIKDKELQTFAKDLNQIWFQLGRQMTDKVKDHPELYSIIYVEHPVIVPGGRFLEFYYWDSYWIILGLLRSEMLTTAKGMLLNFGSIVERYGFIPNGGRVYYTKRSQPPLFIPMIKEYFDHTKDKDFAVSMVDTMAVEFDFWMSNHTLTVKGHTLAYYGDRSSGPRPESYREDIASGSGFKTEEEREDHYSQLKAAAESGMDFSSRWFINNAGTNTGNLTNLKTRSIIPVELNAILHWNAKIVAEFYGYKNDSVKQAKYAKISADFFNAINEVLWNEEHGVWFDYDLINNKPRPYFVPTNLAPLWTGSYDKTKSKSIAKSILKYIKDTGIDSFPGGVPTTLYNTGQQWDMPNVWPPMQHILITGLENLGEPDTKALALRWAQRWVAATYHSYNKTKAMFEKLSATTFGQYGGGGEYDVQLGFGWSNGVILDLLNTYGQVLEAKIPSNPLGDLLDSVLGIVNSVVNSAVGLVKGIVNSIVKAIAGFFTIKSNV